MPSFLTTREIAELLGVEPWRIARLFEIGAVPEPVRFAGRRAVPSDLLPAIVDALRSRGWLPGAASWEGGHGR